MRQKQKQLSGKELEGEHDVTEVDDAARGVVHVREHRVLVPGVYEGERIRLQLVHRGKHGIHHAQLTDLISASRARVDPPCPHFLDCGGCDILHLHPDEQLKWKRAVVSSALGLTSSKVEAVRHAEFHFDYRALAKFVVGEGGVLGSFRRHSNKVARMDECMVHAPAIAAAQELLQTHLQEDAPRGIRYVVMRASIAEERVIVTLICTNPRAGVFRQFAHDLGRAPFVAAVDFHHNDIEGNAIFGSGPVERLYDDGKDLSESIGSLRLQLKSNAFSQVNPSVAELLYREVSAILDESHAEDDCVLDLYAGSGGVGLSYLLSSPAARVTAVESNADAVAAAQRTADAHGLSTRYAAGQGTVLEYLREQSALPTRIIVNPPRKGLRSEVTAELLRLLPEHLIYVSCNPKSLGSDLAQLQERYELVRVVPFDMFPGTAQVETLVWLRRISDE